MLNSHNDPEIAYCNQTSGMKKGEKKNHTIHLLLRQNLNSLKGINAHIIRVEGLLVS